MFSNVPTFCYVPFGVLDEINVKYPAPCRACPSVLFWSSLCTPQSDDQIEPFSSRSWKSHFVQDFDCNLTIKGFFFASFKAEYIFAIDITNSFGISPVDLDDIVFPATR